MTITDNDLTMVEACAGGPSHILGSVDVTPGGYGVVEAKNWRPTLKALVAFYREWHGGIAGLVAEKDRAAKWAESLERRVANLQGERDQAAKDRDAYERSLELRSRDLAAMRKRAEYAEAALGYPPKGAAPADPQWTSDHLEALRIAREANLHAELHLERDADGMVMIVVSAPHTPTLKFKADYLVPPKEPVDWLAVIAGETKRIRELIERGRELNIAGHAYKYTTSDCPICPSRTDEGSSKMMIPRICHLCGGSYLVDI